MSEGADLSDLEALAAEHALGVLSGRERVAAEQRRAGDPQFAELVAAWEQRLHPMLEIIPPVPPPAALWDRLARALPVNDNRAQATLRIWRGATFGALSLAAASLAAVIVLVSRPLPVSPIAPAMPAILNARLTSPSGPQPLFVAAYDPARRALIITSLVQPGKDPVHVHQLWLIGRDGRRSSLGFVEPGRSKSMPMPTDLTTLIGAGASLAVSVEGPGGSKDPHGPSGPIAAVGKLASI